MSLGTQETLVHRAAVTSKSTHQKGDWPSLWLGATAEGEAGSGDMRIAGSTIQDRCGGVLNTQPVGRWLHVFFLTCFT